MRAGLLVLAAAVLATAAAAQPDSLAAAPATAAVPSAARPDTVEVPALALSGVPFTVTVRGLDSTDAAAVRVGGQTVDLVPGDDGALVATVQAPAAGQTAVEVVRGGDVIAASGTRTLPGWTSILPPVVAIVVALLTRRVIPALFLGIWVGGALVAGLTPGGIGKGLLDTMQVYVLGALADPDKASIVLFTFMIGGMVGIIQKNGGTRGIVARVAGWANTPVRGQVAAGVLGLVIFFDDYANSLVIGPTMRPVTDRLGVSRAKLAYIVDSTSAPVASLALVTTWIGFEVGLIDEALAELPDLGLTGYGVFLESIFYRFYPILALFFVFAVALSKRDFGPMHAAEVRARTTGDTYGPHASAATATEESGEFEPPPGTPYRAVNAVLPVLVLVGGVLVALFTTGTGETFREIVGSANSYAALMWASLAGVLVAAVLSVGQGLLSLDQTLDAWFHGVKSMLFTLIILLLSWALAATTEALHTGDFLAQALSGALPPGLVPAIVFLLAAGMAFATGTSWGTMGILMPLVVPLVWGVMEAHGRTGPEDFYLLYSAVSCVLAGAVWGDHCSPISDTTILSSLASGCDHMEHVRTQLPYALSVGLVAVVLGTIPTGFGAPWWSGMIAGVVVLLVVLRVAGRPVPDAAGVAAPEVTPAPAALS